jgi:uncharacterized GH25 family protein
MNRRFGVVAVVVVGIALLALWRVRCNGAATSGAPPHNADRGAGAPATTRSARVDPSALARGSISGTIRDDARAPIARAYACANATDEQLPPALRELRCAFTDDRGHYKIAELVAADYVVHVSARQFLPGAYYPEPGADKHDFALAAGEARTGVDVELKRGGVEVTGVVLDISGGPIARAQVEASKSGSSHVAAATDTDEQGRFSLWVKRGGVTLEARADGYAPDEESVRAPGKFEIILTPASSLTGRVVDAATGQPVSGALVAVEGEGFESRSANNATDAQGKFRVEPLTPGRYNVIATAEHGYGRSEGSLLVGLGQQVDGAVIKLFPARRVTGKVVIAGSGERCANGGAVLEDPDRERFVELETERDGWRVADSVRPGTYRARVHCTGYLPRGSYPPVVVGNDDVTGLVWEVDAGARIRGKVVTRSGEPVDDAEVHANGIETSHARDEQLWRITRSQRDGRFELDGLKPATYRLTPHSDRGVAPADGFVVTVAAAATVERDLVLDDGGTLLGTVVDSAGAPVPGVRIFATDTHRAFGGNVVSDLDGAFSIEGLAPGAYRLSSMRDRAAALRKVSSTDSGTQREAITVRAGQTATARLVVDSGTGTINGTVVDASGKPVSDAFVASAREDDGPGSASSQIASTRNEWWTGARPVLTSTEGRFQLARLAPGNYTLRAYRKGGGEAIAEHVAVGSTTRLQITPTGSIEGNVRRKAGSPPQDLQISLQDRRTHFTRTENFYRTDGHFMMADLPAGHFDIVANGDGSQSGLAIDLREGEARTGVDIELVPTVTVTGRIVEHGTQKPIPAMRVLAVPVRSAGMMRSFPRDSNSESVSDETGKFTVQRVPLGEIWIQGFPNSVEPGEFRMLNAVRTVTGTGTVDLGDLVLVTPRTKRGDPSGMLGLRFEVQPRDTPAEQRAFKISGIDPGSPAAGTGLQVGDVITSCDGVDVTGMSSTNWFMLTQAPPGTKLTIGTRRGVTVTLVLAAR